MTVNPRFVGWWSAIEIFLLYVSEVSDILEFFVERFVSSFVPNANYSVPNAAQQALSNGVIRF